VCSSDLARKRVFKALWWSFSDRERAAFIAVVTRKAVSA
jgi:hypothetical protein